MFLLLLWLHFISSSVHITVHMTSLSSALLIRQFTQTLSFLSQCVVDWHRNQPTCWQVGGWGTVSSPWGLQEAWTGRFPWCHKAWRLDFAMSSPFWVKNCLFSAVTLFSFCLHVYLALMLTLKMESSPYWVNSLRYTVVVIIVLKGIEINNDSYISLILICTYKMYNDDMQFNIKFLSI